MAADQNSRQGPRLYYGWVIVSVVALGGFTHTAETLQVLGVFLKPMTEEFGWSRSAFTGAMTIGTFLGAALAVGVGPLLDRLNPRWPLVIAFSILGGVLFLTRWITALWQLYVLQIFGRMVLMGVISIAMSVIVPKWFVAKRGRAVAISGLGGRLGFIVLPLFVHFLVKTGDWRLATTMLGVTVWALSLLPTALFLRRRPEDMGLLPDGATGEEIEGGGRTALEDGGPSAQKGEVSFSVRQVVREPSFHLLVLATSLGFFVVPALTLHMIPYFTDRGLTAGVAVLALTVSGASSAMGALFFGYLAERVNIRLTMSLNFLLFAVVLAFLLAVGSTPLALLWGFFFGLVSGGFFTQQNIVLADYYGRESLGAIRGVAMPVQTLAVAIGPIAAALAYDVTGSYGFIFTVFSLSALVSALCVFLAKPPVVPEAASTASEMSPGDSQPL